MSVNSINILDNINSKNLSNAKNINEFTYGQYRNYTKFYHHKKSHVVFTLNKSQGSFDFTIPKQKMDYYLLRLEAFCDHDVTGINVDITSKTKSFIFDHYKKTRRENICLIEINCRLNDSNIDNTL